MSDVCLAVVIVNSNLSSATPFMEAFTDFGRELSDAIDDMKVGAALGSSACKRGTGLMLMNAMRVLRGFSLGHNVSV